MTFNYCPVCANKLAMREIGDEGLIPYCEKCEKPYFNNPAVCVICLVLNEYDEVALIRQSYVCNDNRYICVAGYITVRETAEAAAAREVNEELGVEVTDVRYLSSYPFEQKDMLMLGFAVHVRMEDFTLSDEVDEARWFPFEEAVTELAKGKVISQLAEDYITMKGKSD